MNKVVALEGNIGAGTGFYSITNTRLGKSTLCGKVKKMYPDRCSLYKEQGNEKFLKLFYSNPVRLLPLLAFMLHLCKSYI